MAAANREAVIRKTLSYEGGFTNDKRDPGGATNWGITHTDYAEYLGRAVTVADVKAMPLADAVAIYTKKYWAKANCDALPAGYDMVAFDGAVNSGLGRGPKWLKDAVAKNKPGVPVIHAACAARASFLRGLKTFVTFGKGWMKRVTDVEATATKMWLTHEEGHAPAEVDAQLQKHADAAKAKATGHLATAGGIIGALAVYAPHLALPATLAAAALAAWFVWNHIHHTTRAAAYAAAQGDTSAPVPA